MSDFFEIKTSDQLFFPIAGMNLPFVPFPAKETGRNPLATTHIHP
jgi:hypothetical protein